MDDKTQQKLAHLAERLDKADRKVALAIGEREQIRMLWLSAEAREHKVLKPMARALYAAIRAGLSDLAERTAEEIRNRADEFGVKLPARTLGITITVGPESVEELSGAVER